MKKWQICILLFCCGVTAGINWTCDKRNNLAEKDIAIVNGRHINLEKFRQFYELDPNFGIDSVGYPALRDELNKYIDQILAVELVEKSDIVNDSLYQKILNWEFRQALLRQLYRDVVASEIQISEDELREEFVRENTRVHVRHLFSRDSTEIYFWYRQLLQGETFVTLARRSFKDTVLAKNGGDIGWISLGELEENLAKAIDKLEQGGLSQPVKSRWGYHILNLVDKEISPLLKEGDFQQQRGKLEKRIKKRKESQKANQFISYYIGNLNPQPHKITFRLLWESIVPPDEKPVGLTSPVILTNSMIQDLSLKLSVHLGNILIVYDSGEVTLGEYLSSIKKIPISERPKFQSRQQLLDRLGIWIRDELLLEMAYQRDISKQSEYRKEIEEIKQKQSYQFLLERELNQLVIPEDIRRHFEEKQSNVLDKDRNLSTFHTLEEWKWWRAEKNLHYQLHPLARKVLINEKKLQEENAGIDWNSRIRLFMIRKP